MSLQDRLEAVRPLLVEHNDAVGGDGQTGFIDIEAFFRNLKASGASTEDRLKSLSYEDILECLPSWENVKPKLLAKSIAQIFRGTQGNKEYSASSSFVSAKKAERMTPRELVESFDPENSDNSVGKALLAMSKNQPFIVYSDGRIVDFESTTKLLLEVKAGYPGRTDFTVSGQIKPVYAIGQLPDNYADENPLYPNRPLRPDGACDQTGRSWEGIPLEIRQLIRIAIDLKELVVTIETAHQTLDIAVGLDAMTKLRNRYRQSSLMFDQINFDLPKLKISLQSSPVQKSGGRPRPFDGGKKVIDVSNHLIAPSSHYKANMKCDKPVTWTY